MMFCFWFFGGRGDIDFLVEDTVRYGESYGKSRPSFTQHAGGIHLGKVEVTKHVIAIVSIPWNELRQTSLRVRDELLQQASLPRHICPISCQLKSTDV